MELAEEEEQRAADQPEETVLLEDSLLEEEQRASDQPEEEESQKE